MKPAIVHDAHARYLLTQPHLPTAYLDEQHFQIALISVGLLIETNARIFERVRGTTLDDKDQSLVADALRIVLSSLGIRDEVDCEYARQVHLLTGQDTQLPQGDRTAPSAGLGVWRSRIADAAALSAREQSVASQPTASAPADQPPASLSLHSADEQPEADKSPEIVALDEVTGSATEQSAARCHEEHKSPEETQADRAEFDADAGTQGEE